MEPLLLIIPILIACLYVSINERKRWNNGICKENGLHWEYFDTDSQGGKGYKAGDVYTWFSWN